MHDCWERGRQIHVSRKLDYTYNLLAPRYITLGIEDFALVVNPTRLVHRSFLHRLFFSFHAISFREIFSFQKWPGQRYNSVNVMHVEMNEQRNVLLELESTA